jgi:hypothetical protein
MLPFDDDPARAPDAVLLDRGEHAVSAVPDLGDMAYSASPM